MTDFNKRIFGSEIDPKIKNKLAARQILAEDPNPNESIQFTEINGEQIDLGEAIGGPGKVHNFSGDDKKAPYLFELSSRTPWARAWVAVELYYHSPEEFGRPTQKFVPTEYGTRTVVRGYGFETQKYVKKKEHYITEKQIIKKEESYKIEKKVYVLGDNNYHSFEAADNIHNPVQKGQDSLAQKLQSSKVLDEAFPGQMKNNPFMKPPAGITSIETKTEGFAGAIRLTTINFVVHNFEDYQNIYGRFFLKPGATIIVDFGWDTSVMYDPNTIIETDIRKKIYGTGGYVDSSVGDLDVVIGKVTDFTSTTDDNGSFICSVTVKSDNAGLIDYEISEQNKLKSKMVDNLPTLVINKVATNLGEGFLRKDWTSDDGVKTESEWYANSWANNLFGAGKTTNIPESALKVGLYWQSLGTEEIDVKKGFWNDTEADVALSDDNNIFLSWAFFEEELLNKELGFQNKDVSFFGGHFDSIDSFISYNDDLVSRQQIGTEYSNKKTGLKFLYPPNWDDGNTYDTINHKHKVKLRNRPETLADSVSTVTSYVSRLNINSYGPYSSEFGGGNTTIDTSAKRIPLRELFINLSVIKEAFEENDTVSEAILQILDVLNEDSQNVFNLKLIAGTRDNSVMTIVDTNYYNSSNDAFVGDKFDKMFEFKPYSKGSIVKEMSLTYQTPNNSLQTMISIQNKSTNIPLFPTTQMENENQAMRIIYNLIGSKQRANYGIRFLPSIDVSGKNNEEHTVGKFENPNSNKLILGKTPSDSIIDDYKGIIERSQKFKEGEGKELYNGLTDDYFRDEKPSKSTDVKDGSSVPEDVVYADALYAKDLEQYYEFKCRKNFVNKDISTPMPIQLTLTTYGVSGILPGDIFNIDYLPAQYKDRVYFQVMNVEHSVDSSGWKTTLQTQMKLKENFVEEAMLTVPDIYLATDSTLLQHKISSQVKKYFKDFILDEARTTNSILVFKVKGRLKNKTYEALETMNDKGKKGGGTGYRGWYTYHNQNATGTPQAPNKLNIKLDGDYTLLIGNGGAIAVDENSSVFKTPNSVNKLIKYFTEFNKHPNKDWSPY